jgi:hypothetical protein
MKDQSLPGSAPEVQNIRQPEFLAPGKDGDRHAVVPRSQLRDSPGLAPAFLRVATSAQHGTPVKLRYWTVPD